MCNPLLIGAALMVGGAAASNHGAKKAERAAINVRRAEDARQAQYQQQAEGGLRDNMEAVQRENIEDRQTQATASREDAYRAQGMAAPRAAQMASSGSMGGNRVVASSLADAMQRANERVAQLGNARARLNSFGDAMFDTNILLGRGREQIGQAANLAAHSLRPVDAELGAAQHKGSNARALGSLLSTVGGAVMGGAGAASAGAGAGAASAGTSMASPMVTAAGSSFFPSWLMTGGAGAGAAASTAMPAWLTGAAGAAAGSLGGNRP